MNATHSYMDVHSSHASSAQPYGSLPASGGGHTLGQYSHALMQSQGSYQPTPAPYPPYGYPSGSVMSPHSAPQHQTPSMAPGMQQSMLPHLPAMNTGTGPPHGYGASPYAQQEPQQILDPTGQTAPPGMKPRVTATLWEDEGSLCFQVEAKGVCVARREDNHFINGTKLLNVAGMTRGRRDGILKSEKIRNVVKIGPMHLKGVWIPFERALEFANREKITDLLYPLFVHNIDRRHIDNRSAPISNPVRQPQATQPPSLTHHSTMGNMVGSQSQHSVSQQQSTAGRPSLDRAHTFPTPPTSASSVIGTGNSSNYTDWGNQNMSASMGTTQPLSIDTGLSNAARSMPTTPATTPPGNSMPNLHSYAGSHAYDNTKTYYSGPPTQSLFTNQQVVNRYNPSAGQVKSEMGPPATRGPGVAHDGDQHDYKADPYAQRPGSNHMSHHPGDNDAEQDHDQDYSHAYASHSGGFTFRNASDVPTMPTNNSQLASDPSGSPNNHAGSGHVTPQTSNGTQSGWTNGYQTPPRQPQSNLYSIMSDSRGTAPNGTADGYSNSAYASSAMNGTSSNKRGRDDDDVDRHSGSNGLDSAYDMKRRRTVREDSVNSGVGGLSTMQTGIKAGGAPRRR